MDALRAMREARYEENLKRASTPAARPAAAAKPAAAKPAAEAVAAEGLCGHRSMNGRTCTREHGHAAKNHRYS